MQWEANCCITSKAWGDKNKDIQIRWDILQ